MCKLPKNWMLCSDHELSSEFYTSTLSNCESVVKLQNWQTTNGSGGPEFEPASPRTSPAPCPADGHGKGQSPGRRKKASAAIENKLDRQQADCPALAF